jgi:hypothetical protein
MLIPFFVLAIVLPVLRISAFESPFDIFKLFSSSFATLQQTKHFL